MSGPQWRNGTPGEERAGRRPAVGNPAATPRLAARTQSDGRPRSPTTAPATFTVPSGNDRCTRVHDGVTQPWMGGDVAWVGHEPCHVRRVRTTARLTSASTTPSRSSATPAKTDDRARRRARWVGLSAARSPAGHDGPRAYVPDRRGSLTRGGDHRTTGDARRGEGRGAQQWVGAGVRPLPRTARRRVVGVVPRTEQTITSSARGFDCDMRPHPKCMKRCPSPRAGSGCLRWPPRLNVRRWSSKMISRGFEAWSPCRTAVVFGHGSADTQAGSATARGAPGSLPMPGPSRRRRPPARRPLTLPSLHRCVGLGRRGRAACALSVCCPSDVRETTTNDAQVCAMLRNVCAGQRHFPTKSRRSAIRPN